MNTVYVVCWGSASIDDEGNSSAFSGVHGVYTTLEAAQDGLVECKDTFYDEIVNNEDFDAEESLQARTSTNIYGSVEEGHFEIDYDSWDSRNETYISIEEKTIIR